MTRHPLIEELGAAPDAADLFHVIKDRPCSFFLDSGMDPERLGRYSFMGSEPFLVVTSRGSEVTLMRGKEREVQRGDPFDVVFGLLETYALDAGPAPVPFVGGAVGYFGYDLRHFVEQVPSAAVDDLRIPGCCFAFYDHVVAFDHMDRRAYLVVNGFPAPDEEQRLKRARLRLAELRERYLSSPPLPPGVDHKEGKAIVPAPSDGGEGRGVVIRSDFTREEYVMAVEKVREYIAAGDVFQVNLSQRFVDDLQVSAYDLYRRLRVVNPAPFSGYLDLPEVAVVSASPERFLKRRGDVVETRPIKGTRPRGRDAAEDARLAGELMASAKDRAENVMIVDLERNDLGRVCRYGTVRVTELAVLETFPTVHHLTSTVTGVLQRGTGNADLLKAMFPGGSITGAPKVRAMEIIDELERSGRGVFAGSIGYLGFNGDLDINIAIRTFIVKDGRAYFRVGGGVTYASDAEAEYVETLDKARGLIRALQSAQDI